MDINPLMSEAETQRQAQIRDQFVQDYRTQNLTQLRRKVCLGLRRTFVFLAGAMVVMLVISNRKNITSTAAQKIRLIIEHIQKTGDSTSIRNSALTYEKEVDEVAGK